MNAIFNTSHSLLPNESDQERGVLGAGSISVSKTKKHLRGSTQLQATISPSTIILTNAKGCNVA